jgi:1-acyl-sn-glycerol-3-phosphate acyltransferase
MDLFFRFAKFCFYAGFRLFYRCQVYGIGQPYRGGAIIAPNHASFLDPPLICAFWPEETNYLARASLFESWFMKWLLPKLHSHPVTGSAQDIQSMRMICHLLKEGNKVVIFPEGIRSEDGQMQPIKSGISMLALRVGCPIIPVYIHGTFEAWSKHSRWPKSGSNIACVFGNPIFTETFKAMPKKQAQDEMAKAVQTSIENLKIWYEQGAFGQIP